MNLHRHPHLLELLAAAHAVGTLRGPARRRFEAMAREQPAVRAAALTWQGRLAGMVELQQPVEPDPAVWLRIRNLIDAEQADAAIGAQRAAARPIDASPARRGGWLQSLPLWRGAAAAGALATVLAVVVGFDLKQQLDTAPSVQYVAVLANDQAQPQMLVTFDPKNKQLVMQRIGRAPTAADKSLELWALPKGGAPRSLGLMNDGPGVKLTASRADVEAPAMAITLEPKGGAPKGGGPTGPVLYSGPLIEKTI